MQSELSTTKNSLSCSVPLFAPNKGLCFMELGIKLVISSHDTKLVRFFTHGQLFSRFPEPGGDVRLRFRSQGRGPGSETPGNSPAAIYIGGSQSIKVTLRPGLQTEDFLQDRPTPAMCWILT